MAEPFNIDRFMEGSGKVDLSDIDWAEVPQHRITPEALRTLRYFLLTEGSTFFYTKVLMQTRSVVEEPEFAPFVTVWNYEEEFHGRAFRQFLEAYGEQIPRSYRSEMFQSRGIGERIDEVGQRVLATLFAPAWPAVHMVWGAMQEFTTYTAYQQLIERVDHPILSVICQRIMKQEARHFAFYNRHAKARLQASPMTRRVVSRSVKIGWTPVGDGMCPKSEVCHAIRFLFDGVDGPHIRAIEAQVRELPGLEWFDMFTKFAEAHGIGRAPDSWFPAGSRRTSAAQEAAPSAA
jgi:hypothetical protein